MQITLAHLSDLHLGPLPQGALWRNFALKRVVGGLSWRLRRRHVHDIEVANALAADIRAAKPDHVALTGDLVNVAAHAEFIAAAKWLERFGAPDWISVVPGNHDAYVMVKYQNGLEHFGPYMTGSMAIEGQHTSRHNGTGFPYVRFKGSLAMIGLSSAEPQALHRAAGRIGQKQLDLLDGLLVNLKRKGCYRAVMLHHPPLPGLARKRKALVDAEALKDVLAKRGAELVLHGHNHRGTTNMLDSVDGPVPVIGVSSASIKGMGEAEAASWNLYRIRRNDGRWLTDVTVRGLDAQGSFATLRQFTLPS